jgi:hypothetical protein
MIFVIVLIVLSVLLPHPMFVGTKKAFLFREYFILKKGCNKVTRTATQKGCNIWNKL